MVRQKEMKDFWNSRVKNHGHTGWADFMIYAFDQPARLKTLRQILTAHNLRGKLALDFGCGTGDFSNMLSEFFGNVKGFDISEKVVERAKEKYRENKNIQFFTGCSLQQLPVPGNTVDLILCITVLDHIIDDEQLNDTLNYFHTKLSANGILIALEYAPAHPVELSSYQRFDMRKTWEERFSRIGFKIIKEYGFYHPQTAPSASFSKYISDPARRFWSGLSRFEFSKRKIAAIAEKTVNAHNDFFYESTANDLMRIMILTAQES